MASEPAKILPLSSEYLQTGGSSPVSALCNALSSGVILLNGDGLLTFVSRMAEELLGVSADEVVGKRVDMLPLQSPIYRVLSDNSRDCPVLKKIGERVVSVRSSWVDSEIPGCFDEVVELRDVTEERREARQREECVAAMTHDLKSPLTVMLSYLQLVERRQEIVDDADLSAAMALIKRSGARLGAMIDDVLDVYRLEHGLVEVSREYCLAGPVLQQCCRDFAGEAKNRRVTLTLDMGADVLSLHADPKALERVFANLVGNALKFTPRGGRVKVAATAKDDIILVTVADTGVGIPAAELPRIFSRYFRASTSRGYKGSGLGLTIVQTIVEAHGGTVTVDSQEGAGSCFTVTLPLAREA